MSIKNMILVFITSSFVFHVNITEAQIVSQVKTSKVNDSLASKMLSHLSHKLYPTTTRVSNKQAFEVITAYGQFYAISTTSNSTSNEYVSSYTCSLMIFNKEGNLLNSIVVVGASDLRPWTCDSTKAMSFSDWYQDGSLRIIAIYDATAPSSAQFEIPVVLKLNLGKNILYIDEKLTKLLQDKEATTINAAKDALKSKRKY